jgi:16S rRNA (guanine527-N7)-methyltransferase
MGKNMSTISDEELLYKGAGELGITLSREQVSLFTSYYHELMFWNTIAGITSYRNREDVYAFMFLDSIAGAELLEESPAGRAIDMGTGGGFPGLPLKILDPAMELVLMDSSEKKIQFLTNLVHSLHIDGVSVVKGRAEQYARLSGYREAFDSVYVRAFAPLDVLLELTVPYLRVGGRVLAWKGPACGNEISAAEAIGESLGVRIEKSLSYRLPLAGQERTILVVRKENQTDDRYPRKMKELRLRAGKRK